MVVLLQAGSLPRKQMAKCVMYKCSCWFLSHCFLHRCCNLDVLVAVYRDIVDASTTAKVLGGYPTQSTTPMPFRRDQYDNVT